MMKTKSLLIAGFFVLSASVSTFANKPGDKYGLAAFPVKEPGIYKVVYERESTDKLRLNVYNDKSERIFTQSRVTKGFIQPLNFQHLEAGEYTIEIVSGTSRETVRIKHAPHIVAGSFVHITRLNESGKYLVSVAKRQGSEDNITLNIFQDDELIYNESNTLVEDFAKVYSVKPDSKNITIAVTDKYGKVTSASF